MRISDWSSDVCSSDLKDPTFAQWTRAKSFDGFGALGPVIATDIDPTTLSVRTILNGDERQNYPVADMIFQPHRPESMPSHDMTLLPGSCIGRRPPLTDARPGGEWWWRTGMDGCGPNQ